MFVIVFQIYFTLSGNRINLLHFNIFALLTFILYYFKETSLVKLDFLSNTFLIRFQKPHNICKHLVFSLSNHYNLSQLFRDY